MEISQIIQLVQNLGGEAKQLVILWLVLYYVVQPILWMTGIYWIGKIIFRIMKQWGEGS